MSQERFEKWKRPVIKHGVPTKWHWVVFHPEGLVLGESTDIGVFTAIFAHHGVEIADEVQIGGHCLIYSLNTEDNTAGKVRIGRGAKIGAHSTIMPSVTIGEGATIGAYSLVKQDIPAGALAYGIPAKIVVR